MLLPESRVEMRRSKNKEFNFRCVFECLQAFCVSFGNLHNLYSSVKVGIMFVLQLISNKIQCLYTGVWRVFINECMNYMSVKQLENGTKVKRGRLA